MRGKNVGRWAVLVMIVALATACASQKSSQSAPAEEEIVEQEQDTAKEAATRHHGDEGHHHGAHGEEHRGHAAHHDHRFTDPERYAERWNDPSRDAWQQPSAIIDAMGIEAGMTVADIGAGTGYFIPHLSEAVGPEGQVIAVDIEQVMLDYITVAAEREGWTNVDTLLAGGDTSNLGEASVDRIITVNTWHHIPNRAEYAAHLGKTLKPGGSIWVVDYRLDSPVGPPPAHRLAPEVIVSELEAGGLEAVVHSLELERQFIVVAKPRSGE